MNYKLLAILILAVLLRIIYITQPAFYFDEGIHSYLTKNYMEGEIATPWEMFDQPPVSTYIHVFFTSIFGLNEFSMRLVEVFFGVSTVLVVYLLTKKHFDEKTAIIASLLLTLTPLHVVYSRFAYTDVMMLFFIMASILMTEYSFDVKGYKYPILAGFLASLAFLTKYYALIVLVPYHMIFFLRSGETHFTKWVKDIVLQSVSFCTIFIVILTGYDLLSMGRGFVYLTLIQSLFVSFRASLPYRIEILLEGLSPIIFLLAIAGVVLLARRFYFKRNYPDALIAWMVILLGSIILLEARIYPRHILPVLPFAVIAASVFLSEIDERRSKYFLVIIIILMSVTTFTAVAEDIDFTTWREVGVYINGNTSSDARVFTDYLFPNRFYIDKEVVQLEGNVSVEDGFLKMTLERKTLNTFDSRIVNIEEPIRNGDLFLLSTISRRPTRPSSPMGRIDDEIFWAYERDEAKLGEFLHSIENPEEFELEEVFYYKGKPVVWLYRVL